MFALPDGKSAGVQNGAGESMDRIAATWQALDMRRRILLTAAVAVSIFGIFALGQIASRPEMALLYSGLDATTAGEVIGALEQMQIPSDVRGDAIYVSAADRDRIRLDLAREGIPRQGQAGYEILDEISGFSATTEMFDAAYWRAKEGELARTILASPGVRAARVHLATPSRRPFARETAPATASVTVTTAGGPLSQKQALAIRFLVALSVSGLAPEQVAVIDSRTGVLLPPRGAETAGLADTARERSERLKAELEELLEARVGRDKVRVSVTVETDREIETVTEKIIEPQSRVAIYSDTEEIADSSSGTRPSVTVASNLPSGDASANSERTSTRTESRERVNYDYSEVRRERRREPGSVRRIGVAVLVDGITTAAASGEDTWQPRPADELEAIRDLVAAAIGYDESRGDIITVESLAFQGVAVEGVSADARSWTERFFEQHAVSLAQMLLLAAVVLVLALTVIRPMFARARTESELQVLSGENETIALAGPSGTRSEDDNTSMPGSVGIPDRASLRHAASTRQDEFVATLRDWLESAEEEAA